ncbi:restriction endonuclease subunit S, partial [Methanomethylophilus alvi]|uniref:restriction endonuclease subunit S n=1 Tax=Methanomethylophilus alvi TaxID=1291540 RepID=UPI0037DD5A72
MWIRLGELTNYGNNEAIQTKDIPDDSKIIELDDIEKNTGKIISNSKKSNNLESTRHIFRKGCILYSKLRPYLNKVAIPEFDGYCSTEIMALYPNYVIDLNYLHLVLRSPYFVEYAMSKVYGTKMPRLGTSDGKNALIPLAPLNEQQKIVGFVIKSDYLFEECQNLNSILVRLDKDIRSVLTESILQTAIQGKLVPQDPNDKPVQIQCKNPIIRRDNSYY